METRLEDWRRIKWTLKCLQVVSRTMLKVKLLGGWHLWWNIFAKVWSCVSTICQETKQVDWWEVGVLYVLWGQLARKIKSKPRLFWHLFFVPNHNFYHNYILPMINKIKGRVHLGINRISASSILIEDLFPVTFSSSQLCVLPSQMCSAVSYAKLLFSYFCSHFCFKIIMIVFI